MPTINITVTDPTVVGHPPIAGATLRVSAINRYLELTTDADGLATFTGDGICIDNVMVRASAPGYKESITSLFSSGFGTTEDLGLNLFPGSGWLNAASYSLALPYGPPVSVFYWGIHGLDTPLVTGRAGSGGVGWDWDVTLTGLLSGNVVTYSSRTLPSAFDYAAPIAGLVREPYQVEMEVYRGDFPDLSPPAQRWLTWLDPGSHTGPELSLKFLVANDPDYIPSEPPTPSGPGEGPCNLITCFGRYMEAVARDGGIVVARARGIIPPWESSVVADAGPGNADPSMDQEPEGRIYLLFTRSSGETSSVRRSHSDDVGTTWSNPEMAFNPGSQGVVRVERASRIRIEAAYRDGKIVGVEFNAGGASDEFTFRVLEDGSLTDLQVEEQGFDLAPANDEARRWLLVATPLGGSGTSTWQSTDKCRTWKQV